MSAPPRRIAPAAVAAALALLAAGASACGIPAEDTVDDIDTVLFDLDQTTTTSTTTTTTTTVPPASAPPTSVAPPEETTTTIVATTPVPVYFVVGFNDLVPVLVSFPTDVQPLQVIARLEDGPPGGPETIGLRTLVPAGLVRDIDIERGVATIDLDGDVLDDLPNFEGRTAIGQIVLSMRLPGVGQVRFTTDGQPEQIPVPSRNNQLSDPGQPLAFEDFEPLIDGGPPNATTTTTTPSTPAGSAPPPSDAAG